MGLKFIKMENIDIKLYFYMHLGQYICYNYLSSYF